jgi:hypothetical protein
MKNATAAALLLLSFTVVLGCGDDNAPTELGMIDAGQGDASGRRWPGTCDPVLQDCPAGQQCTGGCNVADVMAKVFTCAVPSEGAVATHGQVCAAGCARGHDCFVVYGPKGARGSVCRKYCNTDADCPGTACVAEGVVCTRDDPAPIGRVCAL